MVDSSNADWQLGLDLLIARAALDTELASQLTKDAKLCCKENGINLPDQIKLVICTPDQEVVVKSLPLTLATTFTSVAPQKELVGSSTYNSGHTEEEVETATTQAAASTSTQEAEAEAEAEVVVVCT